MTLYMTRLSCCTSRSAQRWSWRGGANSIKHRRTSHHAKQAPAARVQRFVGPRFISMRTRSVSYHCVQCQYVQSI